MRDGVRCGARAAEVDHIKAGDDHSYANLQALCADCHKVKTQAEAREARREALRRLKYPNCSHPGEL